MEIEKLLHEGAFLINRVGSIWTSEDILGEIFTDGKTVFLITINTTNTIAKIWKWKPITSEWEIQATFPVTSVVNGILVTTSDKGDHYICEKGGSTVWKINIDSTLTSVATVIDGTAILWTTKGLLVLQKAIKLKLVNLKNGTFKWLKDTLPIEDAFESLYSVASCYFLCTNTQNTYWIGTRTYVYLKKSLDVKFTKILSLASWAPEELIVLADKKLHHLTSDSKYTQLPVSIPDATSITVVDKEIYAVVGNQVVKIQASMPWKCERLLWIALMEPTSVLAVLPRDILKNVISFLK